MKLLEVHSTSHSTTQLGDGEKFRKRSRQNNPDGGAL